MFTELLPHGNSTPLSHPKPLATLQAKCLILIIHLRKLRLTDQPVTNRLHICHQISLSPRCMLFYKTSAFFFCCLGAVTSSVPTLTPNS
jgi:hypothetical protein